MARQSLRQNIVEAPAGFAARALASRLSDGESGGFGTVLGTVGSVANVKSPNLHEVGAFFGESGRRDLNPSSGANNKPRRDAGLRRLPR
jgi:hypothetical protein